MRRLEALKRVAGWVRIRHVQHIAQTGNLPQLRREAS